MDVPYYGLLLASPCLLETLEYVTGQKSPNLHHPTENWHETDTNFLFDPLLIPICSMHCNHWVHGKMECPPHLGLLLCCDINCSSQLHSFINSRNGKKDILFWEFRSSTDQGIVPCSTVSLTFLCFCLIRRPFNAD